MSKQFERLDEIQNEIAKWSNANFGKQGYMNPLLGIAEEVGELVASQNNDEFIDAAGDAMIFCMDFLNRFNGVKLSECVKLFEESGSSEIKDFSPYAIIVSSSRILRSVLKLRQCIRRDEDHQELILYNCGRLFFVLNKNLELLNSSTLVAIESTWKNVVSKRDWTKETGAADGR